MGSPAVSFLHRSVTFFALIDVLEMQIKGSFNRVHGLFGERKCEKKFAVIPGHSACLPPSSKLVDAGLSVGDRRAIVQAHNRIRAGVKPSACNMMRMHWNEEVASVAQAWAENCDQRHDKQRLRYVPGRFALGQNIAAGNGNWTSAINTWHLKRSFFRFGSSNNNTLVDVYPYINMVSAETVAVGCGFARCNFSFFVCNYAPYKLGNFPTPYQTDCEKRRPSLLDCGSTICYNGGNLTRDCKCECPRYLFLRKKLCEMVCYSDDPFKCGTLIREDDCDRDVLIISVCPNLCRACPYGGINFLENESRSALSSGNRIAFLIFVFSEIVL